MLAGQYSYSVRFLRIRLAGLTVSSVAGGWATVECRGRMGECRVSREDGRVSSVAGGGTSVESGAGRACSSRSASSSASDSRDV